MFPATFTPDFSASQSLLVVVGVGVVAVVP